MKISIVLRSPFLDRIPSLKNLVIYLANKGARVKVISTYDSDYPQSKFFSDNITVKTNNVRKSNLQIPTMVGLTCNVVRDIIFDKSDIAIDKRVLGISKSKKSPSIWGDDLWRFLIVLRKYEYYSVNCNSFISRVKLSYYAKFYRILRILYGFEIPPHCFGAGLKLNHIGPIIVNENARIGKFCDIHVGVNIGQNYAPDEVPTIGDNVWIGPGVKIFGKIKIADGIMIGANSVVNKSFLEPNITIAGNPAKKIKNTGNPFIRKE